MLCSLSQCARRCCAPRRCRGGTSPVLRKCWSVRRGADMASARWRIVLDQPSPAARPGTRYAWQLWRSPATAKLHNAALLSVSASQSQAPFVAATASRPSGESNRRYAKLPSLSTVAQPSALPGRWHALRAAVCAPLWLSWHRGISQALRAVLLVSGLRPVVWCVPPPTLVLRRCAASALRAGLPVRPPWGLPQPARLCYWVLLQVW